MPGEKKECTADGYPVISAIFPFSFFLNLFSPHLHLKAHCFTWHIIDLTYTTFISLLVFSSCKCINASSLPFLLIKYDWAYILTKLLKRQFGCCCCAYYHHHQDHLDHQAEKNKAQVWLLISARAATSSKRCRPISKRHKHTDTHTAELMLIIIINDDHTSEDSSHFAFSHIRKTDRQTTAISQSVPICLFTLQFQLCLDDWAPFATITQFGDGSRRHIEMETRKRDLPLYTWQTLMRPHLVNLGLSPLSSCSPIHSSIFAIITSSALHFC